MKEKKAYNPPAFPFKFNKGDERVTHPGMDLRDWFAGQFLAGYAADENCDKPEYAAPAAYEYADAMLKARGGGDED